MTLTTVPAEGKILKRDVLGRVKTPRDRREALLAEFDRSGMRTSICEVGRDQVRDIHYLGAEASQGHR